MPIELLAVLLGCDAGPATQKIGAITTGTMEALAKMGEIVQRLLQLIEGREIALRHEARGDAA